MWGRKIQLCPSPSTETFPITQAGPKCNPDAAYVVLPPASRNSQLLMRGKYDKICIRLIRTDAMSKLLSLTALRAALVASALALACSAPSFAQDSKTPGEERPARSPLEPIEEEFRVKRSIKLAQKKHQDNLNRAHELSCLGAEIGAAFKQKQHLDREDLKKIDKLEKLAKSIRSAAGGSDVVAELERPTPDLNHAVSEMEKLASSLKEEVEKTPRRVVSAAVIDHANVLLELIRRIRDLSSRA